MSQSASACDSRGGPAVTAMSAQQHQAYSHFGCMLPAGSTVHAPLQIRLVLQAIERTHPAPEAQAASQGNGKHADMDENEEEGLFEGTVVSIILSWVCWLTNASPADVVNAASNENGHSASEDVAAANGVAEDADMDEDQEEGSSEGDPEEAGEETEISDFDEQAHDGEPASSGGAGNGSGLRPSYGRKVGSPSGLDSAVAKGSIFCEIHFQHNAP